MSEKIKNLTDFDFETEVLKEEKVVVVDFWAVWCGPCRMQAPILNDIADELSDKVKVCKVNVDECEKLAISYGIQSIPTLLFFKGGKLIEKRVGLTTKPELSAILIKHI